MVYALLIDDDAAITQAAKTTIEAQGLHIEIASTWDDGLAKFYAYSPDLVISDYNLPGSRMGLALLSEVSKLRPSVRLVLISAFLNERRPAIAAHSVCIECKRRGNVCVMVAHGTPCLGPVTHAGCGALCPSYDRGCYGCFGPMETPNTSSLSGWMRGLGAETPDLIRSYRAFHAAAEPFREESEALERR